MLPSLAYELFRRQHGLLARHQTLEVLSRADRRRIARCPDVEPVSSRVFRHRAVPHTLGSQLLAPVLHAGPGAVLWNESASLWWGSGRSRDPLVQVAQRYRVDRPIGRMHELADLAELDVTEQGAIPIVRPERMLLGLAAAATRAWKPTRFNRRELTDEQILAPVITKMAVVLDHAWRMGLVDGEFLHDLVERMTGRGQAGIVVLRALLRDRPPGHLPSGSRLEDEFERIAERFMPELDRQVEVFDPSGFVGRVDYHGRHRPLVIEINSEIYHCSQTDRAADDARYERLLATGRSVLVVWEYDIWHQRDLVGNAVRDRLRRRDPTPTLHRPTRAPWELLPAAPSKPASLGSGGHGLAI